MSWHDEYMKRRDRVLAKKDAERRAAGAKKQQRLSRKPEYRTWQFVKDRCHNERSVHFPRYGGRGIRLADEWLNDPAAFIAYMGPKPTPRHSIDRYPNQSGNYEPGNVRWATYAEQNQNRSCSKLDGNDIAFVRHWLKRGYTQAAIAAPFGVSPSQVSRINTGSCWAADMGGV
jgi:hypothetical protein